MVPGVPPSSPLTPTPIESPLSNIGEKSSHFAHETTLGLIKKFLIYRMMGSNLFINYSLMGINVAYRVLGKRLTNFAIESTAASVFTGGVTVADLVRSSEELAQRGIGSIACFVVEGVRNAENTQLDDFLRFSVEAIREITRDSTEGHFALKLTAYISTDLMERLSQAQEAYTRDVLQIRYDAADDSVLSAEQLAANLAAIGITEYSR